MEDSIDQGSRLDARSDHVADLHHRRVRAGLEVERKGQTSADRPPGFKVTRVDHPLGAMITLSGDLDAAAAPLVQTHLDNAAYGSGAVVIDLSGLQFIDSSGLNVLVRAEQRLRASGGRLILVSGPHAVRRVFEVTGLDRYFTWCDTEPERALRGELWS